MAPNSDILKKRKLIPHDAHSSPGGSNMTLCDIWSTVTHKEKCTLHWSSDRHINICMKDFCESMLILSDSHRCFSTLFYSFIKIKIWRNWENAKSSNIFKKQSDNLSKHKTYLCEDLEILLQEQEKHVHIRTWTWIFLIPVFMVGKR